MNEIIVDPAKSIPAFYVEQSIFLTGATGFIGKVFIEKVLWSCPKVCEIFLLIRPKKRENIGERLEKTLSLPLFDRLRKERPSSFKKLIPISGEISKKGLGLSNADRQILIERVTIVVHSAASVKFNNSLKYAILNNTRSTRDICILAENMKNLVALTYVSTIYSNTDNSVIEEKVCPSKVDWRKMIEIAESVDDHILDIFSIKYMDNAINTYVFSKHLAEAIIQDYSAFLPCAIVRPSMITPAQSEPCLGWIDNIYGFLGLSVSTLKGITRVVYQNDNLIVDVIPVDVVVKSLLQVIWKRGLITVTPNSTVLIFNCASGNMKHFTLKEIYSMGMLVEKDIPVEGFRPYILKRTNSFILYYILTIICHIVPAILLDFILKLFGRQPRFFKIIKHLYVANCALSHFALNNWTINVTNTINLNNSLPSSDIEAFKFRWADIYLEEYIKIIITGFKKFLSKEDTSPVALESLKKLEKRVTLFFTILKSCFIVGILWMTYKWGAFSGIYA